MQGLLSWQDYLMAGQPTPPTNVPSPEITGGIQGLLTIGFPE